MRRNGDWAELLHAHCFFFLSANRRIGGGQPRHKNSRRRNPESRIQIAIIHHSSSIGIMGRGSGTQHKRDTQLQCNCNESQKSRYFSSRPLTFTRCARKGVAAGASPKILPKRAWPRTSWDESLNAMCNRSCRTTTTALLCCCAAAATEAAVFSHSPVTMSRE